jgi:hypothetical protein
MLRAFGATPIGGSGEKCRVGACDQIVAVYNIFLSVILSEAKDRSLPLRAFGPKGGAMRPLAVLQSSALWLSHILIGNLL